MHPNPNQPSSTQGQHRSPYYGQEDDHILAAQAAYPTPPNGPYQTTAGPNSYYPGITTSPVNASPYAYAAPYQYASTSTYPGGGGGGTHYAGSTSGVGTGAYAPASYAAGSAAGGGYTYAAPLSSPLSSPTAQQSGPGYFPPPNDGSGEGSSYTSPNGTTHTLAENEALLKRLRNTAASARFRAKKKQRERSLEERERDKREELERLEERIRELELENRFLKGLVWAPREGKGEGKDGGKEGKGSDSEKSTGSGSKGSKDKGKGKGKGKA